LRDILLQAYCLVFTGHRAYAVSRKIELCQSSRRGWRTTRQINSCVGFTKTI